MQIKSKQITVNINESTGSIDSIFNLNDNRQVLFNPTSLCRVWVNDQDIIKQSSLQVSLLNDNTAEILYYPINQQDAALSVKLRLVINRYTLSVNAQINNLNDSQINYILELLAPIELNASDVDYITNNKIKSAYMAQQINIDRPENTQLYSHNSKCFDVSAYGFMHETIDVYAQRINIVFSLNAVIDPNMMVNVKIDNNYQATSKTKKRNRIIAIILLLILVFGLVFGVFFGPIKYALFRQQVESLYDGDVNSNYMQQSIYRGIMEGLDNPYSEFLTEEEYQKFNNEIKQFGLSLSIDATNYPMIKDIADDSPASKIPMYPGDYILAINDTPLTARNAQQFYQITSDNNTVSLKIYRPSTNETLDYSITKEEIPFKSIETREIDKDGTTIGYIKIPEFRGPVAEEFSDAIKQFENDGVKQLFIDVCDNPGGNVAIVKEILDQLVTSDQPMFQLTHKGKVKESFYSTNENAPDFEISVLQNKNSASASEILSLVLKEYANANIIGTTSFGKGTGQQIRPNMFGPGYIKVTAFHWQSGKGTSIEGVGVEPTIAVDEPYDTIDNIYLRDQITQDDTGYNAFLLNNYLYYCGYDTDYRSNVCSEKTITALNQFCSDNGLAQTSSLTPEVANVLVKKARVSYNQVQYNPILRTAVDNV